MAALGFVRFDPRRFLLHRFFESDPSGMPSNDCPILAQQVDLKHLVLTQQRLAVLPCQTAQSVEELGYAAAAHHIRNLLRGVGYGNLLYQGAVRSRGLRECRQEGEVLTARGAVEDR